MTEFAGLRNQGATCYMNSLLQTLYMNYEFRRAILSMPLCIGNTSTPSNFVSDEKFKFLFEWQKLFVELQSVSESNASTENLTDTFGWHGNEAAE